MAVNNHAMWCLVSDIMFIFECLEWNTTRYSSVATMVEISWNNCYKT